MTTSKKAEAKAVAPASAQSLYVTNKLCALAAVTSVSLDSTAADIVRWGQYNGLRHLARRLFRDRNATGFPPVWKLRCKAAARPYLRESIHLARAARTALIDGNSAQYERHRNAAVIAFERAQIAFNQPFKEAMNISREGGRMGGRPAHDHAIGWAQKVDDKMARNPALSRTDAIKALADSWVDKDGERRSWTTIRDALNRKRKAK